jgi:hypothetical protein
MTLEEILVILQNRKIALMESKKTAVASGDLERVVIINNDLDSTINSIESITQTYNELNGIV